MLKKIYNFFSTGGSDQLRKIFGDFGDFGKNC